MKILDHYIYTDLDSHCYIARIVVGSGTILDSRGFKLKRQAEAWLKTAHAKYQKAKRIA